MKIVFRDVKTYFHDVIIYFHAVKIRWDYSFPPYAKSPASPSPGTM